MCRKLSAILLMLIYGTEILAPAMPFLDYYLRKDYIEKNLCINRDKPEMHCHGKCHLKKELYMIMEDQSDKSDPAKKQAVPQRIKEYVIRRYSTVRFVYTVDQIDELELKPVVPDDLGKLSEGYRNAIFHPPPFSAFV